MPDREFSTEQGTMDGCDHTRPIAMMTTGIGYRACCASCEVLGPECSSPKAAWDALLILGMNTD